MHLNLEKLKDTPFEHLPKEDKVALVLVLLKQLQPYLSTHNLSTASAATQALSPRGVPPPHYTTGGSTTVTTPNKLLSPRNTTNYIQGKADEVLKEHGASGSHQEVDALHSILNNINVQHQ